MTASIAAVVVDHDTPHYTELLLRSLWGTESDLGAIHVTVLENEGNADSTDMRALATEMGAEVRASGRQVGSPIQNHGDALRDFVLTAPTTEYILFLDCDVVFDEADTIQGMRRELDLEQSAFAIQAHHRHAVFEGEPWFRKYEPVTEPQGVSGPLADIADPGPRLPLPSAGVDRLVHHRPHPGCLLIRDSRSFRAVAKSLGFSTAWLMSEEETLGGFYDTGGLATRVMETHGFRYMTSTASVLHFYETAYKGETEHVRDWKERRCWELLEMWRQRQSQ